MEEKVTFGKFVARKRKELGMTQKELADRLYVTESAVSKWERGVSYPDITLVSRLCDALGVSEHELIAANEDDTQRMQNDQARRYQSLKKGYWVTMCLLYGIGLLTCFICNLAVDHTLSWFFVVMTAEMLAFSLTVLPLLLERNKALITLGASYLSLNLLLLSSCLLTSGDWFLVAFTAALFGAAVVFLPFVARAQPLCRVFGRHKTLFCFAADTALLFLLLAAVLWYDGRMDLFLTQACPTALFALAFVWGGMLAVRYLPVNGLFRTAVCFGLGGAFCYLANGVVRMINDRASFRPPVWHMADWSAEAVSDNILWLCVLSCLAMAVLFTAGGVAWAIRSHKKP